MKRLMTDESGTTSIEYGPIALLVAVGILSAVKLLGSQVADTFSSVTGELAVAASDMVLPEMRRCAGADIATPGTAAQG